jgi:hypothetical protein
MIKRTLRIFSGVLAAALLSPAAFGQAVDSAGVNPTGTWLVNVSFPPASGVPPFQEMITFHRDGTVSESNTTLYPGSANYFLNYSGSEGKGSWGRYTGGRIAWTVHKFVFCGPNFAPPPIPNPPPGLSVACTPDKVGRHIGYLRIRAVSTVRGGSFSTQAADEQVDLLLDMNPDDGLDPAAPDVVIPFGGADSTGRRLGVQLPY